MLHELGGDAAASLAAARIADGVTPAHLAAAIGYEGCLRVLHELGGDAAAIAWQQQMQMVTRPFALPLPSHGPLGARAACACCIWRCASIFLPGCAALRTCISFLRAGRPTRARPPTRPGA